MSKGNKGKKTARTVLAVLTACFGVLLLAVFAVYLITQHYVNKIDIVETLDESSIAEEINKSEASAESNEPDMIQVIEDMTNENDDTLSESEVASVYAQLSSIAESNAANPTITIVEQHNVTNILLIGTDIRAGGNWDGNSDSMILCTINNEKRTIYLTSIMRDTFVNIEGYGGSKLNRAHALGGAALLETTIEQNFGINIDYYARVDFYALIDIINSLGGIPITISDAEVRVANKYIAEMAKGVGLNPADYYYSSSGNVIASGMQAVGYARIRYVGNSDFGRTQRQRTVLNTIFNQLKASDFNTINSFLNSALPKITTNIPSELLSEYFSNILIYLKFDINSDLRIPADNIGYTSVNEMLVTDFNATNQWLTSIIY